MTWGQASKKIQDNVEKILSQEVLLFQRELLRAWPVHTGHSRREWDLKRESKNKYSYTNSVPYAPIVWLANRQNVTKKDNLIWWHGKGGQLLYDRAQKRLVERLKNEYAS